MDNLAADATARAFATGFEGAQHHDTSTTKTAASAIRSVLGRHAAERLTRFLFALWVASGGRISEFPEAVEHTGVLDSDALSFLIDSSEVEADAAFWRAIGAGLTVDALAEVPVHGYRPNLQALIQSNLDSLWAKAVRVRTAAPSLFDDVTQAAPEVYWTIDSNLLTLQGTSFRAHIGTDVDQVRALKQSETPGVPMDVLKVRAREAGVQIDEVQFAVKRRLVSYSSETNEDVTDDKQLAAISSTLLGATVRHATASVSGGRHLDVDFRSRTASGPGPTRFRLGELVGASVLLLHDLTSEEAAVLASLLPPVPSDSALF